MTPLTPPELPLAAMEVAQNARLSERTPITALIRHATWSTSYLCRLCSLFMCHTCDFSYYTIARCQKMNSSAWHRMAHQTRQRTNQTREGERKEIRWERTGHMKKSSQGKGYVNFQGMEKSCLCQ
ncbi:hypothetical protein HD806DRAFT_513592 [Xylariaceae sp. AK1471]|nr:hypothetical protein HD806DRAFT_513592 [Xylariaceae sp. AK1471]